MFLLPGAVRYIPAAVVLAFLASLALCGHSVIASNLKSNRLASILFLTCVYAIFSYYYHGYGSREMRALIVCFVFLVCFNRNFIKKEHFCGLVALAAIGIIGTAVVQAYFLSVSRVHGFINPIVYATYCASISVLCFSISLEYKRFIPKAMLLALFVLTIAATVLTGSRGVWVGLLAAVLIIALFSFRELDKTNRWGLVMVLPAIVVLAVLLYPLAERRIDATFSQIRQTIEGDLKNSIGIRVQYWMAGAELFQQSPLLGMGDLHQDKLEELQKQGKIGEEVVAFSAHFHNQFLDTLVKKGLVGFGLLLALLLFPIYIAFKYRDETWRKNIAVGFPVLYSVSGLTDTPLNHAHLIYVYVFVLAAVCVPDATGGRFQGINPSVPGRNDD